MSETTSNIHTIGLSIEEPVSNQNSSQSIVKPIEAVIDGGFCQHLVIPVAPRNALGIADSGLGKIPALPIGDGYWKPLPKWQDGVTEDERARATEAGANVGLILGVPLQGQNYVALDFDFAGDTPEEIAIAEVDRDVALSAISLAVQGRPFWWRVSRPGRAAVLFKIEPTEDAGKKEIIQFLRNGASDKSKIEVLARGQQIVIAGEHAKTGKPMYWLQYGADDTPENRRTALPCNEVVKLKSRADLSEMIEVIGEWLLMYREVSLDRKAQSSASANGTTETTVNTDDQAPPSGDLLIRTLERLPHDDRVTREDYVTTMLATVGAIRALRELKRTGDEEVTRIETAAIRWAARWDDPRGVGTDIHRELEKWKSDWWQRPDIHSGWRQIANLAVRLGDEAVRVEEGYDVFEALEPAPAASADTDVTETDPAPQTVKEKTKSRKMKEKEPEEVAADDEKDVSSKRRIKALVEEFNQKYSVVNDAGKVVVIAPYHDGILNRKGWHRLGFRDFVNLHLDRHYQMRRPDGEWVTVPAGEIWIRSTERRSYKEGVIFDPLGREEPGKLNLWQGFAVSPRPGDWSALKDHIEKVICQGNEEHLAYVLNWIARMLQRPDVPAETAIVMRGKEGVGKGILMKFLRQLIGQHALHISHPKHLIGNFNSHLRDCIFLAADEAFFAGDKAHVGVLKSLITEDALAIEGKGQNTVISRNFLHVMMASNDEWVVPAGPESRRFFVLDVSDNKKDDKAYFDRIRTQMESGGLEAFMHDMLAREITGFRPQPVPVTEALLEQRLLSLSTHEKWMHEVLERGHVGNVEAPWEEKATTEALNQSYADYAARVNERRPMNGVYLGRFLQGVMGFEPSKITVDAFDYAGNVTKERKHGYCLGSLDAARAAFEKKYGTVAWTIYREDDGLEDDAEEAPKSAKVVQLKPLKAARSG
jgi:hypothetical protein